MNSSGWMRGIMSKNLPTERFLTHVVGNVDAELIEWGHDTMILYHWDEINNVCLFTFLIDSKIYTFQMKNTEIKALQNKSPYALDRSLWEFLARQGIHLRNDGYMRLVGVRNSEN